MWSRTCSLPRPCVDVDLWAPEGGGKLLMVDLDSLEGDGPARIEVLCQAPANMDGLSLVFYFGKKNGEHITYEIDLADLDGRAEVQSPSPPPASSAGGQDEGDDLSQDSSSDAVGGLDPPSCSGRVVARWPPSAGRALGCQGYPPLLLLLPRHLRRCPRPPCLPHPPGPMCRISEGHDWGAGGW